MTAAQLVAPGRFELVHVDKPDPGPRQVRVAVEGCGVCASNLPAWSGRPWFHYPLAPGELGHEGWGEVEALGADVDASLLGRRVAMASHHAYAGADLVDADDLILLPESLSVAPLEPFGCVFNVADRAAIVPEQTVAVVGLGFIGLGLARLAVALGARVMVLSSNPSALESAAAFGVTRALPMASRAEARQAVADLTNGLGCATVAECTGHQEPLDLAGDIVAEGGRLVIAGFHQDGPRQVNLQQWNWKGIDVINAHERSRARIRRGMRAAADALADDPSWVGALITDTFPLADIDAALERASRRPPGFVKATVLMAGAAG
jgi:threonine dehydrogenase-like Zn-dependent dehydrogenase